MTLARFFCLLLILTLIFPLRAQARSATILEGVTGALRTAFNESLVVFDRTIREISRIWDRYLEKPVMEALGGVIDYLKAEWRYRKSIFREEWAKERVELREGLTKLWNLIF